MGRNSHFGQGGAFKCEACGRKTRDTGVQGYGIKLCPQDYELAGIYNTYQDEGEEGIAEYAAEIKQLTAEIVEKGGKLDGDAQELLAATQEPEPAPAKAAPTNDEIIASLKELAFLAETVAHLTGKEDTFLPPAERGRELIERLKA